MTAKQHIPNNTPIKQDNTKYILRCLNRREELNSNKQRNRQVQSGKRQNRSNIFALVGKNNKQTKSPNGLQLVHGTFLKK